MSLIVTVNHVFEVGPILGKLLEATFMANFETIKQTIADLKTRVDAETAQGADLAREVRDLKAQVSERLTPEQAEELQAELAGLQDAIGRIVADAPADGGGTGEPAPGGETAPAAGGPTP